MAISDALQSGMAGAIALTAVHEIARRQCEDAPRMDILGQRAIEKISDMAFGDHPTGEDMQELSLAGDVAANSLYYSLVGAGDREGAVARGALLGLAAGVGAVILPGPLGLGTDPSNHSNATRLMTIAWYTIGGVVAGSMYRLLGSNR